MKTMFMYAVAICVLISNAFAQNSADALTGTWLVQDGSAKVKIEKTNGKYDGKLVWLNPPLDKSGKVWLDTKNPDKSLRNSN